MPVDSSQKDKLRKAFGLRLKMLRSSLGRTQDEMAFALGIQMPRYNKYEIGRSEPPFELLIRIANLTGAELDYLIAGKSGRESPADQLRQLAKAVPTAAVIYDPLGNLIDCNDRFRQCFFPGQPGFPKPGTPLALLARAWGNSQGLDPGEIEIYIQKRMNPRLFRKPPVELSVGTKTLHLAESVDAGCRLTLITDVTQFRA